jgi:hypothetical protein
MQCGQPIQQLRPPISIRIVGAEDDGAEGRSEVQVPKEGQQESRLKGVAPRNQIRTIYLVKYTIALMKSGAAMIT